jgi:hypothetical protein
LEQGYFRVIIFEEELWSENRMTSAQFLSFSFLIKRGKRQEDQKSKFVLETGKLGNGKVLTLKR